MTEHMRRKLQRGRKRASRLRLKEKNMKQMNKRSLLEKLVSLMRSSLRGKRVYTPTLVELISKVGTSPSAAGARGPLASIIKHVTDLVSDKLLYFPKFPY